SGLAAADGADQGDDVGEAADVRCGMVGDAVAVRVEVHGGDASPLGAPDVGVRVVADHQGALGTGADRVQGELEDGALRLAHPDQVRVDHRDHRHAGPLPDLADTGDAELPLDGADG